MSIQVNLEDLILRKARAEEAEAIWSIIKQAIDKRKEEGSNQWQDGYPNLGVIQRDIELGYGYVHVDADGEVYGYLALIFEIEPAYEIIEGKWLTDQPYGVVHRIAVSQANYVKGQASKMLKEVEELCKERQVYSLRVDTNFDNVGMLRVFEKLGYTYCGEVYFRGGARRAYEKVLN